MNPGIFDQLFTFAVKKRPLIILIFQMIYIFLFILILLSGYAIYFEKPAATAFLLSARTFGQLALITYIVTTIPGICRRFGLQHRLIQILMIFRRYFGILMYLLAVTHYLLMRGFQSIFAALPLIPEQLFTVFGFTALVLLTAMVLTSNDFLHGYLGKWWQRIHNLTYVIIFLIFLHVALQRISIWAVLIGINALLQLVSHIYYFLRKKSTAAPLPL